MILSTWRLLSPWKKAQAVIGMALLLFGILLVGKAQAVREINNPYATSEQTEHELFRMAEAYGGEVITIGRTREMKPIYLYRFGDGPGFMFDGRVHGPEDCGTQAGEDFIRWVYTSNESEAVLIRENVSLLFIPSINKDRPTSRLNAAGVNLNRNFANGWGTSGTSYPGEDYRGPYPESEPETKAVMKALRLYDPRVYFNVHCGMEIITGGGNATTSREVLKNLRGLDSRETYRYYSPHFSTSCGTGGYVKAGACDENTSAWLFELSTWGNLPDTRDGFLEKWRPAYLPFYEAAALTVANLAPTRGIDSGNGSVVSTLTSSTEPKLEPLNDTGKEENQTRGELLPPPVNNSQPSRRETLLDKLRATFSQILKRWPVTHRRVERAEAERFTVSRVRL